MTNTIEVFKNDDTNAFGRGFVRIKLKDADKINITRAVVSCGDFYKDYSNPVFPLDIDMNASETSKLRFSSYWYISIFDEYGRKHTFKKAFCIKALDEVTPTGEGVSNSALRTSNVETIEVENDLTTPLQEITIEFNMAPDKLSQLEDDVQLESRLTSLSEILDSLIQREYTIPKKTSDLINDSGFLTSHQDISGKVDKVTGKGLSTEDYTTAEKTKLAGLSNYDDTQIIEALDGKADVNHTHSQYLTEHQDISGKVDKVTGKGLSTEDYTTAEKTKLAGLSNYDDTEILSALDGKADVNHTHSQYLTEHQDISGKVDKVTGKGLSTEDYTTAEKTKLAGLSNYDDTEILSALDGKADVNHTHSQYLTEHQDISGKVDKVTGKGLSTEDYTTAEKTKLAGLSNYDDTQIIEALDGKADVNHTHSQYLTEHQDISGKVDKVTGKGLSTEDYTTEEKTKLAGLSNYDDTQIIEALDGKADVNHTHSQYLTEHQDISRKVDKVTGKGLSTNDFTDSYKNKLDNAITGIKMNDATVGTSGLVDLGNVMTIQGNIGDFTSVDSLNLGLYYFDNVSNSQLPVTTNASGFLIAYGYYGQVCLVGNKMYYRQNDRSLGRFGNWQVAITNSDLFVKQDKANLVTSLSASSTDTQYPSAKCVYNIVGDIETALNTINSGVSS